MRYRFKPINFNSSEKNNVQNSLNGSNIMISSVVSDTFGVSSIKIINHIFENLDDKSFAVSSMLHEKMKDKAEAIRKLVNINLTKPQAGKIRICLEHFDNIKKSYRILKL